MRMLAGSTGNLQKIKHIPTWYTLSNPITFFAVYLGS